MSGNTPTAASRFPFPTILDPVRVPEGYFPIEIVQFWRGEDPLRRPYPLHWTIIVRTSSERGNSHEIVGDMDTYATQDHFDIPLKPVGEDWRGSHVIGYVSPVRLDDLLNRIALVPVVRHRTSWNCQDWVYEALKGLRYPLEKPELYTDENMKSFEMLQGQMQCLLDAWERADI